MNDAPVQAPRRSAGQCRATSPPQGEGGVRDEKDSVIPSPRTKIGLPF